MITFKGITSDSLGLYAKTENWPIMAAVTRSTTKIPKRAGVYDFGVDTYNESGATITFSWRGNSLQEVMETAERVSGWLNNDGKYYELKHNAYPNRKYYAKVTQSIPMYTVSKTGAVSVTFTFNPPYPFALDNSPISPQDAQDRLLWDTATLDGNQYIQRFSASGTMRFTVGGISPVKPVIKLIGRVPSGTQLTHKGTLWQFNALLQYDGIKIDCQHETVTRISDGFNLFGSISPADYFTFTPGQNSLSVAGSFGVFPNTMTVILEFTPIYGGA